MCSHRLFHLNILYKPVWPHMNFPVLHHLLVEKLLCLTNVHSYKVHIHTVCICVNFINKCFDYSKWSDEWMPTSKTNTWVLMPIPSSYPSEGCESNTGLCWYFTTITYEGLNLEGCLEYLSPSSLPVPADLLCSPMNLCSQLQHWGHISAWKSKRFWRGFRVGTSSGATEDQGAFCHHPHEGGTHQGAGQNR